MKFLCDVHISYKIVKYLRSLEFEAIRVNEILDKWHTKDSDICTYGDENDLIFLTKDVDFRNSFLISNTPNKLVKVNLGNLSTSILIDVISENLQAIQKLNSSRGFMIELDQGSATFIKRDT
jgi:predicted nuclease of predicted toxin-antitoxin system